jgi:cytochrome c5
MTPEQVNQIADRVKTNLLNGIDREVDAAMTTLGINAELSDEEWQALIDMILT